VDVSECRPTKTCNAIAEDCALPILGPMMGDVDDEIVANSKLLNASADGNLVTMAQALEDGADVNTRMPLRIRISEFDDLDPPSSVQNPSLNWDGPDVPQVASLKIEEEPDWWDPLASHSASLTPLMHAAKEGHAKAVVLLLSARAIPKIKDSEGMQALHYAASSGSQDACRVLLDARANPLSKDENEHDAFDCVPADSLLTRKEQLEWQVLLHRRSSANTNGGSEEQQPRNPPVLKQTTDGTTSGTALDTSAAAPCLLTSGSANGYSVCKKKVMARHCRQRPQRDEIIALSTVTVAALDFMGGGQVALPAPLYLYTTFKQPEHKGKPDEQSTHKT